MAIQHFTNHGTRGRSSIMYFLLIILGTLFTTWCLAGCGQQNRDNTLSYINLRRVGNNAIPATVYIEVIKRAETAEPLPAFAADPFFRNYFDVDMLKKKFSGELTGRGTGMIIDSQGHILTNNHIVSGATMIEVMLTSGRWCSAKLIGSDSETDLAVIRVSNPIALPHVIFGDSDILAEGEPVATVEYVRRIQGNSRPRLSPTIFGGKIRTVNPNGITYCSICPDYFTTDIGNNWGNSGAILLNRHGEVVGVDVAIVTQSDDARTLGFAIPINTAAYIASQLIASDQEEIK